MRQADDADHAVVVHRDGQTAGREDALTHDDENVVTLVIPDPVHQAYPRGVISGLNSSSAPPDDDQT